MNLLNENIVKRPEEDFDGKKKWGEIILRVFL